MTHVFYGVNVTNDFSIDDPSSNKYNFIAGTLGADTNIILPDLTTDDTFLMESVAQTLENKTIVSTSSGGTNDITVDATDFTGVLSVSQGGTGTTTHTTNAILKGDGANDIISSGITIDSSDNVAGVTNIAVTSLSGHNPLDVITVNNNIDATGSDIMADAVISDSLDSIAGAGILVNDDIILNQNDITDCNNITARTIFLPAQSQTQNTSMALHIASTSSTPIWLQADTDNSGESDLAYFNLTEDGGATMHYIGGGNNTLKFISGSNAGTQGILWQNATVTPASGNVLPTFTGVTTGLALTSSAFTVSRPTNFSNNNITGLAGLTASASAPTSGTLSINSNTNFTNKTISGIGALTFQTQPTQDDTSTRILTVDSVTGNVEWRDSATIINNPFDQDLNTTNGPTFAGLTLNGDLTMNSNINMSDNSINNVGGINFGIQPLQDDTSTRILAVDSVTGDVEWRDSATIINNPFDQDLNTTNDVQFDSVVSHSLFMPAQTQTHNTNFALHAASTGNVSMWLQADTDNVTEADVPEIYMTHDNGSTMHFIGGASDNFLTFTSATTAVNRGIKFQTADIVPATGNTLPQFSNISTGLTMTTTDLTIARNTTLSNNNLTNINLLNFQTQPTNDEALTRMLMVNSFNGDVSYRNYIVPQIIGAQATNFVSTSSTTLVDMPDMSVVVPANRTAYISFTSLFWNPVAGLENPFTINVDGVDVVTRSVTSSLENDRYTIAMSYNAASNVSSYTAKIRWSTGGMGTLNVFGRTLTVITVPA